MKKQLLMFLAMGVSISSLFAQQTHKINGDLLRAMQDKESVHSMIDVLVQGNQDVIHDLTDRAGGIFKYAAGNIAAVRIPLASVNNFTASKDITRIESYMHRMTALNDTMRVICHVNEVQQGLYPLTQAYDGSGIVVGFIDSGVDFTHPDLIDSTHHSRVKWIWDMGMPDSANKPLPFAYGQEWNNTEIDAGAAGNQSAYREFGHGTHVTGIATGNGLAANLNKGVAPKADIIMVAYDFNYNGTATRIADAVQYIFSKADAMGKPCVINASLGDYFGSHDGQDLEAQLIDAQLTAKNGRCLVAAAGNWGTGFMHLGYTVSRADTNFTWYSDNTQDQQIYMQMWGDSNSFKNIHFAVAAEDTTTYTFRAFYPFSTIAAHLDFDTTIDLLNGSNRIGKIRTVGSTQGNLYEMEFLINPDSSSYRWRLMTTGTGHFDLWSLNHYTGDLPSPAALPSIVYYKKPDLIMNTSNSFACSNQVITVANYTDRNMHYDCHDTLRTTGEIPGGIADNSSIGPTRDGRLKPDISAPGNHVLSCTIIAWIPDMIATNNTSLGLGCYHVKGGGTSAASPVVAGVAALYLQKYPHATNMDIKNAITGCAKTDNLTGNALPDNRWGYGKVDAFHALTGCPTGLDEKQNGFSVMVYPNPFSQTATLVLNSFGAGAMRGFSANTTLKLIIYDVTGRAIRQSEISPAQLAPMFNGAGSKFEIERGSLNSGIYFYDLLNEKQILARGKMIIQD